MRRYFTAAGPSYPGWKAQGPRPEWPRRPEQSPSSLYFHGLRNKDVVLIGDETGLREAGPRGAMLLAWSEAEHLRPARDFSIVPVKGDSPLRADWNDLKSFAGLSPGLRWTCGVPFATGARAASRPVEADVPQARVVFVAYAPPDVSATQRPTLALDNGESIGLAGKPVLAGRGWPPCFERVVLLDRAEVPAGHRIKRIDPAGTLVCGVTAFLGSPRALQVLEASYARAQRIGPSCARAGEADRPASRVRAASGREDCHLARRDGRPDHVIPNVHRDQGQGGLAGGGPTG